MPQSIASTSPGDGPAAAAGALRRLSPITALAVGLALLLALAFIAGAASRRLNFDESLALRAGWLLWEGIDGEPSFLMPMTLALGGLSHAIPSPTSLFLVIRLAVSTLVLASLVAVARAGRLSTRESAVFIALCLAQGAFALHAYEMRYDAAILVGLLLGLALLLRPSPASLGWLGALAALLFFHHLKGVWFGVFLYGAGLLGAWIGEGAGRRRRMTALHVGAFAAALTWVAACAFAGRLGLLTETYSTFFDLAQQQARVWPWDSLSRYLLLDAPWWLLIGLAIARGARAAGTDTVLRRSLPFAAAALGFLFLHPHPWPYMLALPAPFLALAVARWAAARPRVAVGVLVLTAALAVAPWSAHRAALAAPRESQEASLEWLRRQAVPGDTVFDPSGLAYFLPPCTGEWYLDTLFAERAAQGRWMTDLESLPTRPCPWIVNTYRLGMVPAERRAAIAGRYRLLGGGIGIALDDSRARNLQANGLSTKPLRSFWW